MPVKFTHLFHTLKGGLERKKKYLNLSLHPLWLLLASALQGLVAEKRSIKNCSCLTFKEGKSPFCNQPILTQIKNIPREPARLDLYLFIAFDVVICSALRKRLLSGAFFSLLSCWFVRYTRLKEQDLRLCVCAYVLSKANAGRLYFNE